MSSTRRPGSEADTQIGVMLLNLGGPDDLASVEPFLVNLFSDRDIIELPLGSLLQPLLARLIARLRGPSVRRNYALIGGGSPQLRLTREQAAALGARLGDRFHVSIAMRYWRPSTEESLLELKRAGIHRVVTLPLFPHWSKATTGSSERHLRHVLEQPEFSQWGFEVTNIGGYAADPGYLDAFTDTVRRAFEQFPPHARDRVVLLFSAHGLPQKFVDEGDPYIEQIETTRRGILRRLALTNRQVLAYQSRTGPVKWIGPGTGEVIGELAREGVKNLLVIPLSFVSDHLETLWEVDLLFAEQAKRLGVVEYRRSEALGTHPLFIEALTRLVENHLAGAQ